MPRIRRISAIEQVRKILLHEFVGKDPRRIKDLSKETRDLLIVQYDKEYENATRVAGRIFSFFKRRKSLKAVIVKAKRSDYT